MSHYEVMNWLMGRGPMPMGLWDKPIALPEDWNPSAPPPPWVATIPHDVVDYQEYSVPAYHGDVEKIEWEREHGLRK